MSSNPPSGDTEAAAISRLLARLTSTDLGEVLAQQSRAMPSRAESLLDELCRAFYTESADMVLLLDAQATVVAANRRARLLLARPVEPLLDDTLAQLLAPESTADLLGLLAAHYVGEFDGVVELRDGQRGTVRLHPLLDGALTLLVFQDSSRIHQLEMELQRARGLAGVGFLAADLAEAVVNPLGVIQGRLELLLSPGESLSPVRLREHLEGLREHAHRIERAVLNLQAVAAPRAPERARVPLMPVVEMAVAELGRRRERLRLELHIEPPSLAVFADAQQLYQIVSNLLWAAVTVTPTGRRVSVQAEATGDQIELVVDDEGQGLTDSQLQALRTARTSQMPDPIVGLPIAITWILVHQNSGQMEVHNRLHLGTRCRVSLPREAHRPHRHSQTAELSLLVVDDDRMLCETVGWMLGRDGCRIRHAYSAEETLQILARHTFDAILIDIRLAGMDGLALRELLVKTQPALAAQTVLISALPPLEDPERLSLQKPFQRAQLLELVRRIQRRQTPATPEG